MTEGAFRRYAHAAGAALKIYFDVAIEGLGHAPDWLDRIFAVRLTDVRGADDLGRFRAAEVNVASLLARCAERYSALRDLTREAGRLATHGTARDRWRALDLAGEVAARLTRDAPAPPPDTSPRPQV